MLIRGINSLFAVYTIKFKKFRQFDQPVYKLLAKPYISIHIYIIYI